MEPKNIEFTAVQSRPSYGTDENDNADKSSCVCDVSNEFNNDNPDQGAIAKPVEKTSNGGNDMLVGALWCIGGIVFTAATYSAVKDTGGTYYIAWGAIAFGGYQFLKGLFRSIA